MDSYERYEVEQIVKEKTKRLETTGRFFDDYENDCIELWDAIEKLQETVKRLRRTVKILVEANGAKAKVEA